MIAPNGSLGTIWGAMQKWEYTVIKVSHNLVMVGTRYTGKIEEHLEQLGGEGWEMVGAGANGDGSHNLYFKRQPS